MVVDDHVNCSPGESEVLAARRLAGRERRVDGAEEEHEKTRKHADKHRSSLTLTPIIHLPPSPTSWGRTATGSVQHQRPRRVCPREQI